MDSDESDPDAGLYQSSDDEDYVPDGLHFCCSIPTQVGDFDWVLKVCARQNIDWALIELAWTFQ